MLAGLDKGFGAPGVRELGAEQDQVQIIIVGDTVANVSLPTAVEGEADFILGVVVPVKRDLIQGV